MRPRLLRVAACGVAGVLLATSTACATSTSGEDAATVTISVAGMPPTTQEASRKQFLDQIAAFERANPKVKIDPSDAMWEAKTFTARLAGGQLETVFIVPLTEPQGMIKRRQVADITDQVRALPNSDKFDERALKPATGPDDKIYGLPTSEYALGLIYNRELFVKAGLDPNNPPTTWDEVRAAAKAISEKTGIPGYAQPTTNNTGGWTLSAMTYTYGGRIESEKDGQQVPAFTDGSTQRVLEWLKTMRWQDNSLGTQHLRNGADVLKDFSAGRIGMTIATPSTYGDHVTKFNGKPAMFGVTALPTATTPATLLGGSMAVVSPKATKAEREAAVKWIDFYYLKVKYDPVAAEERAKAQAADNIPVGVPTVPFYQASVIDPVLAAVNKHANVSVENFAPFLRGVKDQEFVPEPPVAGQDVYAALDSAVQAVLTRQDADPAAELRKAEEKIAPILERAQR